MRGLDTVEQSRTAQAIDAGLTASNQARADDVLEVDATVLVAGFRLGETSTGHRGIAHAIDELVARVDHVLDARRAAGCGLSLSTEQCERLGVDLIDGHRRIRQGLRLQVADAGAVDHASQGRGDLLVACAHCRDGLRLDFGRVGRRVGCGHGGFSFGWLVTQQSCGTLPQL